jgi:hypothetical protein
MIIQGSSEGTKQVQNYHTKLEKLVDKLYEMSILH